jgi:putative inorganic carbon (hco3(-)) transporter
MLFVLALMFYTTHLGYRLIYSLREREDRVLCLGLFLGIMTFFVHGFLNNFLDTDKLSLPFWAYLAALICFDIYYGKKQARNRKVKTPRLPIPINFLITSLLLRRAAFLAALLKKLFMYN